MIETSSKAALLETFNMQRELRKVQIVIAKQVD